MDNKNVNENAVEKNATQGVSKSQQKRIDRQQKNAQKKTEAMISNAIGMIIVALIVAGVVYAVGTTVSKQMNKVTPNSNFSTGLDDNGMIQGTNASKCVSLPADYASIQIAKADVTYTDEEFEEEKANQLKAHQVLNSEATGAIETGNKINLDYVGSIDGVEFEGGSSNGEGYDLEIGSGAFIPGFEDALIGHKVGENFDIDVTFPTDYSAADLAGKASVFNVTINGIYEDGVFDDAFVAENLVAYANTVDEYRTYLADKAYEERLEEAVVNYLKDKTTVNSYPKKYLSALKSVKKYSDQQSYEYMNQMYLSYYGQGINSFEEYVGMTEEEYDKSLSDACKDTEKMDLIYQAIAEKENITVTEEDVKAMLVETSGSADNYEENVENYGIGYLMQTALADKVKDFCVSNASVQ